MSELIEKQAVIDALLAKMDTIDDKPEVVLGLAVAAGMIKDMPSALEQEPCEDCVSREAVLEIIRDFEYKNSHEEMLINSRIKQLPSVTPAEKVGRWEYVQYDGNPNIGNWHCSECNRIVCGAIIAANPVYSYKYCPQCGCKMSEIPTSCSTCILDNTDACTRGAGRAVDDEACEDYLVSPTGAEGSDKE